MSAVEIKEYVDIRLIRYDVKYRGVTLNDIYFSSKEQNIIVRVPNGFYTDFASIPRVFYALILPIGKHTRASIIHDYLYSAQSQYSTTRKQADLIFLECMLNDNVAKITAYIMYYAVRLFGKFAYKKS